MRFAIAWLVWVAGVALAVLLAIASRRGMEGVDGFGWQLVAAGAALYPVPALLAWSERHRYAGAITALDLGLGWTGLGWLAALAWALLPPSYDADAARTV